MDTIWQDIRFGLRMLIKNPGFTAVAVLTLALGIGANTAIFSVVNAVLLRPLPYPEADRLVFLWSTMQGQGVPISGSAWPDYREWRAQNRVFDGLAGFYYGGSTLTGADQGPDRVQGAFVTANLFTVLRVNPAFGRLFAPEEEQFGRHRVVLLSHGLWQRRYGADPAIIGRAITLSGEPYTVVGVMPPWMPFFDNRRQVELWAPIAFAPNDPMGTRGNHYISLVGRLKPGVTMEHAQADVSTIARQLEEQYPENKGLGALVVPLHQQIVGDSRSALLVLLGAVAFVLLVACVNVANLLLTRATAREREFAIRASLGASHARLIRQLVIECLPLGLLGGAAGLLLALWGMELFVSLLPGSLPRHNAIGLDGRALAFTFALSLLTVLMFGLLPAFQAAKRDVHEALNEGGRGAAGSQRQSRLRGLLVVSEIALTLVLLVGAGLMARSFAKLRQVDAGFTTRHGLTMRVALPASKYPSVFDPKNPQLPVGVNFFDQLLTRVEALPGVKAAAVSTTLPLGFGIGWGKNFSVEGRPAPSSLDHVPIVQFGLISHDYFRARGIAVRRGRPFTLLDNETAPPVAIINETLMRQYFPNEDPLGKTIWMGPPEHLLPSVNDLPGGRFVRRTIVGVMADVKSGSLSQPASAEVYVPYRQCTQEGWFNAMTLVVQTAPAPESFIAAIKEQARALDRDQPVTTIRTMDELFSQSLSQAKFSLLLLSLFASVALLLAAVGIYGVLSYTATQRTHEIGIRMALGAQASDVLKLVMGQGMKLALIGVAIGLMAAFALTRVMKSLLFAVSASDPLTFAGVALLLAAVALLACYVPARRATKVDPMVALRYE